MSAVLIRGVVRALAYHSKDPGLESMPKLYGYVIIFPSLSKIVIVFVKEKCILDYWYPIRIYLV